MNAAHGLRVYSDDPEVAEWLTGWISAMQLDPPVSLSMEVRIVPAIEPEPDARAPFEQPQVVIRSGPPQGGVRIDAVNGTGRAVIAEGAPVAHVAITRGALVDREGIERTLFTAVLVFLLRRAGWHHVHAAVARDPKGRDWLFAGNAESGKSTTAALLATRGWGVGSDDLTFLAQNGTGIEAIAQRAPLALRAGGMKLLGLSGGLPSRGGRKNAFFPEELGGSWAGRITPKVLVLPRVGGGLTSLEPIRPREALAELVRWSAWVALEPDLAQGHLDMLGALARQAACYRLELGPDLFGGQDLLMQLLP